MGLASCASSQPAVVMVSGVLCIPSVFHKASAIRPSCFVTVDLPLQTVHGGITALTFDNLLGWALFLQGTGAVFTASLKVTH